MHVAAAFVLRKDLSGGERCPIPENYRNGNPSIPRSVEEKKNTGEKRTELGKKVSQSQKQTPPR